MQKECVSKVESAASKVQAGVDAEVRRLRELDREMLSIISKATKKQPSVPTAVADLARQLDELEQEKQQREREDRQRELDLQLLLNEEAAAQSRRREQEKQAALERERLLLIHQQEEERQRELREAAEREKEAVLARERKLQEDQAFKQMMDELNATIKRGYESLPSSMAPPPPPDPFQVPQVPQFHQQPHAAHVHNIPQVSAAHHLPNIPQVEVHSPPTHPIAHVSPTPQRAQFQHDAPRTEPLEQPQVPQVSQVPEAPVAQLPGSEQLDQDIARNYRPIRSFSRKIVAELQNMPLYTVESEQPSIPSPTSAHNYSRFPIIELHAGQSAEARQLLDEKIQPLPLDPLPEPSRPPILQRAQSYKHPDVHSPQLMPDQPHTSKAAPFDPHAAKQPLHQIPLPQAGESQGKGKK
jgi:hypothetical protein